MHRITYAAVLVAVAQAVAPAAAVPPNVMGAIGTISPGLGQEPAAQRIDVAGTPWIVGPNWCSFSGTGYGTAVSLTGTLSGSCGPTTYTDCPFVLTPSTWTIACASSAGAFHVRFLNALPTTLFAADGAMA